MKIPNSMSVSVLVVREVAKATHQPPGPSIETAARWRGAPVVGRLYEPILTKARCF